VSEPAGAGVVVVKIPVTCELTGIQLAPAGAAEPTGPWEPPAYADPETFDEQDVTVGTGALAVPGTLSLPHEPGPRPAVVLLGGSGPGDRDQTIGRNKLLKDVAWGLASRGVAVLRFDKVTYAHPGEVAKAHDYTVADEYVPHAVAAVHLLRQVRYVASLDPETAAASQPAIDSMTERARLVDSPGLAPSTPASELPFGVPAPYWLDLRGYNPVAVAAALDRPILILQGGRDYQVTVADDLAGWKTGLAGRADVTIRIHPPDNHFLFPGTGPSAPAESEPVQHVDPAVIADIASWLTTAAGDAGRPGEHA
jgi:hypothetical protein